eukprot:Phypoly_transcript_03843.p1 GENE.Phypoly_transcript_03843~~Phypoly_transcript_03843.p1  ORF type:complete len:633 (+),score=91.24 Phypoly_transcript_03843:378-2276(+)
MHKYRSPWKHLFFFMCYLYADFMYSSDETFAKQLLAKLEKIGIKYVPREGWEDDEDGPSFYELSYLFVNTFLEKFISDCNSPELADIFLVYFGYYIQCSESRILDAVQKMVEYAVSIKKKSGYRITKKTQPNLYKEFLKIIQTDNFSTASGFFPILFNAIKSLMSEGYALAAFSNSFTNKYTNPNVKRVVGRLLAYFGSPLVIEQTLSIEYKKLYIDAPDINENKWFKYVNFGDSDLLVQKLGLPYMVEYLLGNADPKKVEKKGLSPHVIDGLQEIIRTSPHIGIRLWALWQVVKNTEFYEFWKATPQTTLMITNLLIAALTLPPFLPELPETKICDRIWRVHYLAQHLLIFLGAKNELDMALLKTKIDEIITSVDIDSLPLNEVNLGDTGNSLCWAVHVALKLNLETVDEYRTLAEKLLMQVPNLDAQLRLTILHYCGAYAREGMHPRWFLEMDLRGIEIKHDEDPDFIKSPAPAPKAHLMLQKKIVEGLTKQLGIEVAFHPPNTFGGQANYKTLRITDPNSHAGDAEFDDDDEYGESPGRYTTINLSQVGPYAQVVHQTSPYLDSIKEKIDIVLQENGVQTTPVPEVNLYAYDFYPELGPTKLPANAFFRKYKHWKMANLLFYWFSWTAN